MRLFSGLLLRFVCSLALIFSALPIRAGVVCVSDERVVGPCAMAALPVEPPAVRKACCPVRAVVRCPSHKGVHCEAAYRPGSGFVESAKVKAPHSPLLLLPPPFVPLAVVLEEPVGRIEIVGTDSGPPVDQPYAPDRGRAPPVAS